MTLILSGSDGLSDVDGTAAAPALRGTDTNTGIFFGTDIIGFSEGGVESARFNADAQFVAAAGTAALPVITTTGDTNTGIFFPAADTIAFSEGGVESMRIDSAGNVGIGQTPVSSRRLTAATSSQTDLSIVAGSTSYGQLLFGYTGADNKGIVAYNNSDNSMQFYTNATERARIDSSGILLVNRTSANGSAKVQVSGAAGVNSTLIQVGANGDNAIAFLNASAATAGSVNVTASATAYNTSSDYRLKEAIAPMTGALAKVALLKPVTYKWKVDGSDGQGFIAHELQEVVEGCVTGEKDAMRTEQYEVTPAVKDEEGRVVTEAVMGEREVPAYQGIDTSFLVATLTAAIQELKAIVDTQAARITALEAA